MDFSLRITASSGKAIFCDARRVPRVSSKSSSTSGLPIFFCIVYEGPLNPITSQQRTSHRAEAILRDYEWVHSESPPTSISYGLASLLTIHAPLATSVAAIWWGRRLRNGKIIRRFTHFPEPLCANPLSSAVFYLCKTWPNRSRLPAVHLRET